MTEPVRCRRCRRALTDPEWIAAELGRVCAARLGLVRAKRARATRPGRAVHPEQPSLLDHLNEDEGEMTMQKIPTLFLRDPEDMRKVLREVHPECKWVLDGEGVVTRKYDGVCVMYDGDRWWARRDVKPGKQAPANYVPVGYDEITGKTTGWEPIEQSAFSKFHAQALDSHAAHFGPEEFEPGTYELIGVKVNGNPEQIDPDFGHQLMRHDHAETVLGAPRDYDGLAAFLADFPGEGIVWHHPDGRMAKLKRRDFPQGRPQ